MTITQMNTELAASLTMDDYLSHVITGEGHFTGHTTRDHSDVYVENGFANRGEYLDSLCEEYDPDTVMMLAELLGRDEDFDGLITTLQDGIF